MNAGDYVQIIGGDHAGVYGRISQVSKSTALVFVNFATRDKGWGGQAIQRGNIIVLTRKQYFKAMLNG